MEKCKQCGETINDDILCIYCEELINKIKKLETLEEIKEILEINYMLLEVENCGQFHEWYFERYATKDMKFEEIKANLIDYLIDNQ